jgi:N-acetylmuramoyl-L-alanine amidase
MAGKARRQGLNTRFKNTLSATRVVGIFKNAFWFLQANAKWLLVTIGGLTAATATFVANFQDLSSRAAGYLRTRAYLQTRQHPFPTLLNKEAVDSWTTGRLELAVYQIDGYLAHLKKGPKWMQTCLTDKAVFPRNYATQYNDLVELPETNIDRQNKEFLWSRINDIELNRLEDRELLRINDPFEKLLRRSSIQLLHRYKDSELVKLDPPQLYLLRNSIYARHGFPFSTEKLEKYSNRKGWSLNSATYKPSVMSPVELCNAYYLDEIHPARELGALGRGIFVRAPKSRSGSRFFKAALCACLAEPKISVECRDKPDTNEVDEFRDNVDLIINLVEGQENSVTWTFIDPQEVAEADLDLFTIHEDSFLSAALELNATLQATFMSHRTPIKVSDTNGTGRFWGAQVMLTPQTFETLGADPTFLREVSNNMCNSVQRSFETVGPFIPRLTKRDPQVVQGYEGALAIFEKPIVFDDLRIKLTQQYILKHYGLALLGVEFVPKMIVIHMSGNNTLAASYEELRPTVTSSKETAAAANEAQLSRSVHYLIDRDGNIYSIMPDFYIAKQETGMDMHAIGVSNVGTDALPPTDAQIIGNARLCRFLKSKYPTIQWLIGASESRTFSGSTLWEERDPEYRVGIRDPGPEFLAALRNRLADLKLKSAP